ncbi:MAG: hypothetical protein Aurels2KO_40190 [Aureliella sp.]
MSKTLNTTLAAALGAIVYSLASPSIALGQDGSKKQSSSKGIAVVELFTSQGCSSCPPADKVLQRIAETAEKQELPVYALSFHVDYWNQLGWKDPYSDSLYSRRQRAYASRGNGEVYTPQMIVNGSYGFVGSHSKKAQQALGMALGKPALVQVVAERKESQDSTSIDIDYSTDQRAVGGILNVAVVDTPDANAVPLGENAGRKLSHVNVVRAFKTMPIREATGHVSIDTPEGVNTKTSQVVLYIQDPKSLAIVGATAVE